MSDYNPYTDGPAEPIGLAMDANGNLPQSSLAPATLLDRAELPDRFDVIVDDYNLMTASPEVMATAFDQWIAIKAELIRRGYTIWESRNEEKRCYVATCAKRPNADLSGAK